MTSESEITTPIFVSMNPSAISDAQARDARGLASKHGLKWAGVKDLEDVIGKVNASSTLVLVGDDWSKMIEFCKVNAKGAVPTLLPLWTGASSMNDSIDYYDLMNGSDLEDRLEYLGVKKIACLFGNFQSGPLVQIISKSNQFARDYHLIKMPQVQGIDDKIKKDGFNETFLGKVDLFITMEFEKGNKYSEKVSTDYMLSKVSAQCQVVRIPRCSFYAYFPQANSRNIPETQQFLKPKGAQRVFEKDCYVEEALQTGRELIRPDSKEIDTSLDRSIKEMAEREKGCDVVISDYILQNYRQRRLFYTHQHPTGDVLLELARRILIHLGYTDSGIDLNGVQELDNRKEFIYPEVYERLNLEFHDDTFVNKKISEEAFDEQLYLSSQKLLKQPEYWRRSIRWINEPIKKSIDFSANISSDATVKISFGGLDVSDSATHLSVNLTMLEDANPHKVMFRIPECMAPSKTCLTIGHIMDGRAVNIRINPSGRIELLESVGKGSEMLIDTTWLF